MMKLSKAMSSGWPLLYLKIFAGCLVAAIAIKWITDGIEESNKKQQERAKYSDARQAWETCSKSSIRRRVDAASKVPIDIVERVLADCKPQYEVYEGVLTPGSDSEKKYLLNQIARSARVYRAHKEKAEREELIGSAIEKLAREGITRDDLKSYFREEILEEEQDNRE